MADTFATLGDTPGAPATFALAIVPHDSNPLANIPKALFVGTGGDITMRGVHGAADQIWKNVASGALLPFRAQYVRATGTAAADMLALY